MGNMENPGKSRSSGRLRAKHGALTVLGDNPAKVGQVIDVDMKGLSFRYMAGKESSNESSMLNILVVGDPFLLRDLPVETLSDLTISEKIAFSSIAMKRLDVKFGRLTNGQLSKLQYFIENFTKGETEIGPRDYSCGKPA
jgi:hypothetical protein